MSEVAKASLAAANIVANSSESASKPSGAEILISQGAEARVWTGSYLGKPAVFKHRFVKKYRLPDLDANLRRSHMAQEARLLVRAFSAGVSVPAVYHADLNDTVLVMEHVQGASVRDHLFATPDVESVTALARTLGSILARLHDATIIHGDLTTSNMIVNTEKNTLTMIDFGLGSTSSLAEDKAVDLYVLERALLSTHPNSQLIIDAILDSYRVSSPTSPSVLNRLEEVRMRGRKKIMIG